MTTPRLKTFLLTHALIDSGVDDVCRVPGCMGSRVVEVHHIMPLSITRPGNISCSGNHVTNLAFLCRQHHALIERYYFWSRQRLAPAVCKELVSIAREFHQGIVPPFLVSALGARTKELWQQLNELEPCQNPLWWQATFAKALRWASSVVIVRDINPKNALIEEPWFRVPHCNEKEVPHAFEQAC